MQVNGARKTKPPSIANMIHWLPFIQASKLTIAIMSATTSP